MKSRNFTHEAQRRRRLTLRNLALFSAIVLASGWLGRWLDLAMGNPATESLGMLLWLVTPSLFALLLRAFAGDGWADSGFKPNFQGNGRWYLVALLVNPMIMMLTLAAAGSLQLVTFPGLSLATVASITQTFLAGVVPQFIKNIFEEAAWRGYLTPKVYSLGLNDYAGHLLVGFIWGAWHIPYYLFFLDRSLLQSFTSLPVAAFIPLSIVVMMVWALVYGELRLLTGSIWPLVLMHMVEDAFVNQLLIDGHVAFVAGGELLASPVTGAISILLFLAVGVGLNRYRKRHAETRMA